MSILSPTNVFHAYRAGGPLRNATFTRAGAAYHRNRLGYLVSTASGVPRLEWRDEDDDDSFETPALCLERAITNECTQSADLTHTDWSTVALSSRVANQGSDPEGGTTLDELIEDGTTAEHGVHQVLTLTADATYTFSAFFMANTRSWARLKVHEQGTPANVLRAWYNLSTGAVGTANDGGTGTLVRAYMEDWSHVAVGLYRCVLVGSIGNSATSILAATRMSTADNEEGYAGDGASSIYAGYVQMEDAVEFAGQYVPTTTTAASSAADSLAFPWRPKPAQPFTRYTRWYDGMFGDGGTTATSAYPRIWDIGLTVRLSLYWTHTATFGFTHANGSTDDVNQGSITVNRGDLCEVVVTWVGDGNGTAILWINSSQAAELNLAGSVAVATAWDEEFTSLNARYSGSPQKGSMRLIQDVAVGGVLTGSNASLLSQMRGLRTAVGSQT